MIKKTDGCENNPEKSSTTKLSENIPYRYSMSVIWIFDNIENKHSFYRGQDCMKKLCSSPTNVINFEKNKMLPLTKKGATITPRCDNVTFAEKDYPKILPKMKIIEKLETIAILHINIEVQHIVYA